MSRLVGSHSRMTVWFGTSRGPLFQPSCPFCYIFRMKLNSSNVATGWEISDIVMRDTHMPMYDSSFTRLDLRAVHLTTTGDHAMYLERENRRRPPFNDCALYGGSGYCLQLYLETGARTVSASPTAPLTPDRIAGSSASTEAAGSLRERDCEFQDSDHRRDNQHDNDALNHPCR